MPRISIYSGIIAEARAVETMAQTRHSQRCMEPLWRPWNEMPEDFRSACMDAEREVVSALRLAGFDIVTEI